MMAPTMDRRSWMTQSAWLALWLAGCRGERDATPTAVSSSVRSASASPPPSAGNSLLLPADDPAFIADVEDFSPKRPPKPGDWLHRFPSTGLTFDEYVKSRPVRKTKQRQTLVLQPIGPFDAQQQQVLTKMAEFTQVFFDTPTTIAAAVNLPSRGKRTRTMDGRTFQQVHTQAILNELLAPNLPSHAVCLLGITMTDLYPDPSWNYVFGEATLESRVGVYSLARYFPGFWGQASTPASRVMALRRSFKVLAHETGHMFSLHHCVRFECLMNGSNSLEEMDGQPGRLCAACLKMLHWNLGFDVRSRYRSLRAIYAREGLNDEASWVDQRLTRIGSSPPDQAR